MFLYLGKGWRRKEKEKLFHCRISYTAQKMILKDVVVFAFFLDACNLSWDMYTSVPPHFQFIILLHFEAERSGQKSR